MTTDRAPARPARHRLLALPAVLGVALGAAACSGEDGSGLSYAAVRSTAQQLRQQDSAACPFGLDLAAALKDAGIDRAVTPGSGNDRPVVGETGDGTPPYPWPSGISPSPTTASAPGLPAHAWITCVWTAGGSTLQLDLEAVPLDDVGVNMMLPAIQRAAGLSADDLGPVATGRPKPGGKPVLTPGRTPVAIARVPLDGDGDLVLMLSRSGPDAADPALTGAPLGTVLDGLRARIHG
ncbi:hypothetical protein ACFV1L_23720 [Kitasatospora sp. NPDC059646]|uniref:hypothetical protein n=1 Tax=Kitasatospora sp. NPDC059646 TaxID=3346893 RepID=UPI00368E4857